jgi:hypothetical protein
MSPDTDSLPYYLNQAEYQEMHQRRKPLNGEEVLRNILFV